MNSIEGYVAFHSLKPAPQINPNIIGLPEVIAELRDRGLGSVFVPKDAYDWEQEVAFGHIPVPVDRREPPLQLSEEATAFPFAAGGILAVRSRIATPGGLRYLAPVVNDNATRAIGGDKRLQAALFWDFVPETVCIHPGEPLSYDKLGRLNTDTVVIKASRSRSSRHARIGVPREEANDALRELRAGLGEEAVRMDFVAQEMAPGVAIPGLEPLHPDEVPPDEGVNNELRIYCFADRHGDTTTLRPYALYRLNAGTESNQWVPIDQSSEGLAPFVAFAGQVTGRLLDQSSSKGVLAGIDMFKATPDGPIRLREINSRDPGLGSMVTEDESVRRAHSRLLAEQLSALALNSLQT